MVALRSPAQVMRLQRMGSFHATRLSFMPTLLRRLDREQWRFSVGDWSIGDDGVGHAVYTVHGPERSYSLVCFAHDLPDEQRSDRVIATAWDATFALFDGVPDARDMMRLTMNVPKQEAGRISDRELTLSRANRSVRLFEHVVASLAEGRQPDRDLVDDVGYLMRTTAVYGSGKFGAADRVAVADRPEMRGPFQAEMLTVWLIRAFVLDLVEHLARIRGGDAAVAIEPGLRRRFGIGNSTGLGMAPFLMNHPVLLNNWIVARETALQRVRERGAASPKQVKAFRDSLDLSIDNVRNWRSDHPLQQVKLVDLNADLNSLLHHVENDNPFAALMPWDALWQWGESNLSVEGQEALVSLLLEPHADIVDSLSDTMDADEDAAFHIDGSMTLGVLRNLIVKGYGWALDADFQSRENSARFWYVSEEKLEPRLGERYEEPGADLEQPLATGRDVALLAADIDAWRSTDRTVAAFLLTHPEHRHAVRRVQTSDKYPFAEIRDNLIAADMLPIDLLRCKLSFFGATRFDPRSDRWVRICMYLDAFFPHELLEPA
ncbi:MAG: hypothetical protein RIC16_07715 [Rhodospirillales bacterium]